jgi:hypothetical protein
MWLSTPPFRFILCGSQLLQFILLILLYVASNPYLLFYFMWLPTPLYYIILCGSQPLHFILFYGCQPLQFILFCVAPNPSISIYFMWRPTPPFYSIIFHFIILCAPNPSVLFCFILRGSQVSQPLHFILFDFILHYMAPNPSIYFDLFGSHPDNNLIFCGS